MSEIPSPMHNEKKEDFIYRCVEFVGLDDLDSTERKMEICEIAWKNNKLISNFKKEGIAGSLQIVIPPDT